MMTPARLALSLILLLPAAPLIAEVGDPTIQTDHPQYSGEGAFQTVEDCVRFATADTESSQDRAVALYLWLLTHQYHLMSPQEWCIPGRTPDTERPGDYELVVYDANRARFSYGYGLCGTVHSWNEPYWRALGFPPRRRAFPGHVNSEVFYDGAWHAFDTDMAGLLFRKDGVVAGYDDLIRDPGLADSVRPPLPHYPFAWPGDFDTMKKGWQEVSAGGAWYRMYNSGYAAHPAIVHLRSGETFTRWFDRDHYGGPAQRRFWHHHPGGPQRNWTYMNAGEPFHDGAKHNARSDASYCNGEFVYRPDLAAAAFREGVIAATPNVAQRDRSPKLFSRDGGTASVTFRHFSPYVICGRPEDGKNPMSARATSGLVVNGWRSGKVRIEVSADEGQTWQVTDPSGDSGPFSVDLTEHVKGRYGWQVCCTWDGDAGLDDIEFTTVTQVCQAIYPRLKPNGTEVTYRAGSRGVVAVLPNFALPEDDAGRFEDVSRRSANLAYRGRSPTSRLAYETTDNRPASVVFRIEAPAGLRDVHAAIRYAIRVPPPENGDFRLAVSTDDGTTWHEFARADIPADNEFSSGWLAGSADVSAANAPSALVRASLYAGGHRTGLIDAQLYGVYGTEAPGSVEITHGWNEGGIAKTHAETVPAGAQERRFHVPTGANVRDEFVRISAP